MTMRNTLARIAAGAVGLIAATSFAAPALAADAADLEVRAAGTTIAADAAGKFSTISLINNSDVDATGVTVALDISKLDTDKIDIDESGCSPRQDDVILCGIEGDVLPAGADIDWVFPLTRKEGSTGSAGELTVAIEHEGTDPNPDNNSVTVEVKVGNKGVDLGVIANDVLQEIDLAESTSEPVFTEDAIHPGDTAAVIGVAINQGDMTADGVKVSVALPEHVTFAAEEEGCKYSPDNRTITCDYEQIGLAPLTAGGEDLPPAAAFWFPIKVAEGVTAPVALKGGTFAVAALAQVDEEQASTLSKETAPKLPANVKLLNDDEVRDVDPSDNVDGFSVIVAAKGGSGGGDGDDDGPGLPVTGVQAGLIGGVGAGVVALGGALFLVARRRRVVLVTPGDEKPTA
jgi:hypothetical protein